MSKHGKAARKASFRFHAHPKSVAVALLAQAHNRSMRAQRVHAVSVRVVGAWVVTR